MTIRIARRTTLALLAMPGLARAQGAWVPMRPKRLVLPFAPGDADGHLRCL